MMNQTAIDLTIFTAPKPFSDSHIATIQRNAIGSWLSLGAEVLVIGDETGIEEAAIGLGARHLDQVERNQAGTPLISSIFERAQSAASHRKMIYVNADVLLLADLSSAIHLVTSRFERYLIVGQRWDLDLQAQLDFGPGWGEALRAELERSGRRHPPAGSDYFVFPRGQFQDLPRFALGRAGWDNWMIYQGRRMRLPVVDGSSAITAVHQTHDYGHLDSGAPHYRLPESLENVRLGGGRAAVFTLADCTWRIEQGDLYRIRRPGGSVTRWLETSLVVRFGPGRWHALTGTLIHPLDFIRSRAVETVRLVREAFGQGARAP